MSIRTKLLLIALLPFLATVALVVMVFGNQSLRAATASQADSDFSQRDALADAAIKIGKERLDVASGESASSSVEAVDVALVAGADFYLDTKSSLIRAAGHVSDARADPTSDAWRSYQLAIDDLLDASSAIDIEFPSVKTADNNASVEAVIEIIESSDRAWVFFAQLGDSAVPPTQLTEAARLFGISEDARADVRRIGSGETQSTIQTTLRLTEAMSNYKQTATEDLFSSNRRLVTPEAGLAAATDYRERWISGYERIRINLGFEISQEASQARQNQILSGLCGLLALIVIGSLGVLVQRSVSSPLQTLLDGTDRLTGESLPDMVAQMRHAESEDALPAPPELQKRSSDEIGDLVSSFNEVGRLAHRLATEQLAIRENASETLFNYGERQARSLDRLILGLNGLEIDERNIALLAKLGELDHLASAIRRNAQSMVVLGGDYAERPWSPPVLFERVARAAMANIENYDRVNLSDLVPGYIDGSAAADLQHILAELLENALNSSNARSRVVLEGFWSGKQYILVVSDDGGGMSAAEIAVNNRRIKAGPKLRDGAVTQLGLNIVGLLAARHGIEVALTPKDTGVNAVVTLPPDLVSTSGEVNVPTSLSGGPAPRTQRQSAQLPPMAEDSMPPGALPNVIPDDLADIFDDSGSADFADIFEVSENADGTSESADEAEVESKLDYESVSIAPDPEPVESPDSAHELPSSANSDDFAGSVDNSMAAAIESLNS